MKILSRATAAIVISGALVSMQIEVSPVSSRVSQGLSPEPSEAASHFSNSCATSSCAHHQAVPRGTRRVSLDPPPDWRHAVPGETARLGFPLGPAESARVISREVFADGRTAVGLRLPGHDLQLVFRGSEWGGRALSKSGASGWILHGEGNEVVIEELPHESLICSVVGENGVEIAGLPVPADGSGDPGPLPEPGQAVVPPILDSRPGANGVIYLDFDGETVSGTQWNSSFNDGNPIVAAESGLTADQIERVWAGIAEDYRPFGVNVTTDRSIYDSYPLNRRAMLIFTPTVEWYTTSGGVGGVAYVDIFGSSLYDYPGWVFTGALGYNASNCHEAGSHEAGHILGLRHDGTSTAGYYSGHGSTTTSWAPIMGLGYSKNVTQWSKGEYTDANNFEDDLAIITRSYNGLGHLPDDHSNTPGGATPMTESGTDAIDASGLIETNTDLDLFSFQTSGGSVSITASNAAIDPNLDIRMRLLNFSGTEIAVADPLASLDATVTATLAPGIHYIEITGTGTGDPSTGYSGYASLGGYTLTGTAPRVVELAAEILSPAAAQVSLPAGTGLFLDGLTSGAAPAWEILSSPPGGSAVLSAPGSDSTRASFTAPGLYRLRLGVISGSDQESDEIEISVEPAGTTPAFAAVAPGIDLGSDRQVYDFRTTLNPSVGDDGQPSPLTYQWQILSGDGQLSATTVASPELVFSTAATTRLRLTASDGDHRSFADLALTPVFFDATLVAENGPAAATVCDSATFATAWKSAGYNDSAWLQGTLGAGFDLQKGNVSRRLFLPLIGGLDLGAVMAGTYAGSLLRVPFLIDDPAEVLSLTLRMKFDDGFIAYLNGTEIARMNVPAGSPAWNTLAAGDRFNEDALSAVNFPVALAPGLLVPGTNVLALHGMNSDNIPIKGNSGDTEFLLLPSLEAILTEFPESPFLTTVSVIADPERRGAADDADSDGRPNLLEHAAGTSVNAFDPGYPMLGPAEPGSIGITLPASPPADVRYLLEYSPTLTGGWTVLARREGGGPWQDALPTTISPGTDGREHLFFDVPPGERGFHRLRFELLSP